MARVGYREIFIMFIKIGCAFGGGLGVLASLQEELVEKKKLIGKEEFLTTYAIAKIVPGGTIGAIAVAFGNKYKGLMGSIVAITALTIPGFSLTMVLCMLYFWLRNSDIFSFVNASVLPAALGLIVVGVLGLAKDVIKSPLLISFALCSFTASFFFKLDPSLVLTAGGILAALIITVIRRDKNGTF